MEREKYSIFAKKLNPNDKEEFEKEILVINYTRAQIFSIFLFVISIVLILTDSENLSRGLDNVGTGLRVLFYLHVILATSLLIYVGLSWLHRGFQSHEKINYKDRLFNALFSYMMIILCAVFAINDQLIDGKITIYVMGALALAMINYLTPLTSLLMYSLSYIIFIVGITLIQHDPNVLIGNYINGTVLVCIAWFLSCILYNTKIKEFISRKTIDKQNYELSETNTKLRESLLALDESQNMIFTLTLALESKDQYTSGHSERVADYSITLANALGLDEESKVSLWRAAILHDTGKIGIPDAILNKPAALTDEEWYVMKSHPERGEIICSKLKFAQEILPVIRHHHERYDGTGYPDGIKGENIPYFARIIAIADMVDAVISQRPYRNAQSLAVALQELKNCSGTQFDPALVEVFLDLYSEKSLVG
jgi:putative nucleotidyltransferase with HDIG domain